MTFTLDITLNRTRRVVHEAEARDVGGAVCAGSLRPLAFGSDLSAGGRRGT